MTEITDYLKSQTEYIIQRVDKFIGDCKSSRSDCTTHQTGRRDAIRKEFRWVLLLLIGLFVGVMGYSYNRLEKFEKKLEDQNTQITTLNFQISILQLKKEQ